VYLSPNAITVIKSRRQAWLSMKIDAFSAVLGTPEEKRPLGRPRLR